MIPKPLDQIEWADLEELKDSGREESDTIEYKASFSGGPDYLGFSDSQREKALKSIAREVVAFLNGRGGDVVIGAEEEDGDNSKIKLLNLLPNVATIADRLAQSLSAVIEPYQSVIGVRAIRHGSDDSGVIVVRAPQSLRAPHRLMKDKECYIRRGRESVPMPMDEIQEVTMRRSELRKERLAVLDEQMTKLNSVSVGRQQLGLHRFHIRMAYLPHGFEQIIIDDRVRSGMRGRSPTLRLGQKVEPNDVAFGNLGQNWRPILRGSSVENLMDRIWNEEDFLYCAKAIRNDGLMTTDFACRSTLGDGSQSTTGFHFAWIAGYLANSLCSFANILEMHPVLQGGILRVGLSSSENISMGYGEGMWGRRVLFPVGCVSIPDWEIFDAESLKSTFQVIQADVASIAGIEFSELYAFSEP